MASPPGRSVPTGYRPKPKDNSGRKFDRERGVIDVAGVSKSDPWSGDSRIY